MQYLKINYLFISFCVRVCMYCILFLLYVFFISVFIHLYFYFISLNCIYENIYYKFHKGKHATTDGRKDRPSDLKGR